MSEQFKLPRLGEGIEKATVVEVYVSEGDAVEAGQNVISVESDKATADVPVDVAGRVKQVSVGKGDTVHVGDVLLTLESGGESSGKKNAEQDEEESRGAPPAKKPDQQHRESQQPPQPAKAKKTGGKGGAVEVKLPNLGEGAESGTVVAVKVNEGDEIEAGDALLEIETGKATAEVPAEQAGRVKKVSVREGDTLAVGDVILTLEAAGAEEEAAAGEGQEGKPSARERPESQKQSEEEQAAAEEREHVELVDRRAGLVMAAPSVRRLAREIGVNIHAVPGSGPGGRILDDDVKAFARQLLATAKVEPREGVSPVVGNEPEYDQHGPLQREPMSGVRRAIAQQMSRAWNEVPRVTHFARADFTQLEDARKRLGDSGTKVSVTALLVRILALAMKAHPRANAVVDMDREAIVRKHYVNVGVAVDTERGLLVPVVQNADRRSVVDLGQDLRDLAERARQGKLKPDEMRGATVTLTNIGGLGGEWFTPIVNAPEVAILGVGKARLEPAVHEGQIVPRLLCPLSLSYDHRALDGADAARLLAWIVDALENPLLLVVQGTGGRD